MRPLIDAHTLLGAVDDVSKLSPAALTAPQDPANDLFVNAGTIRELAIKVALGKLTLSQPFRPWIEQALADLGAIVLPIRVAHADVPGHLAHHHRDPFDRLLIEQALVEGWQGRYSVPIKDRSRYNL